MGEVPARSSVDDRISATDSDLAKYCRAAVECGATHAKQIHPSSVVTAPWVVLKCQYGCPGYRRGYCCPPHTPTYDRTRVILDSFHRAILAHIEVPDMPEKEKHFRRIFDGLVEQEGVMFKDGFYKAFTFLAGPCRLCRKCGVLDEKPCQFPWKARPCMEACGMDVYQTARNNGFSIHPLSDRTETNNEYCLIVVD